MFLFADRGPDPQLDRSRILRHGDGLAI